MHAMLATSAFNDWMLPGSWPRRTHSARVGRVLSAVLLVGLCVTGPGCPTGRPRPDAIVPLELAHSPEPRAEAAYREAEAHRKAGAAADAQRAFKAFIKDYPTDPLVPHAKLELGRLELDAGRYAAAQQRFTGLVDTPDPALRERARMFRGIAAARLDHHQEALPALLPMVGRTVDPAETAMLLDAIARAEAAAGNTLAALEARDKQLRGELTPEQRTAAEAAVGQLVVKLDPLTTLARAYELLPRDGYSWPFVADRSLRDAHARGQRERVAEIADDMHSADAPFSAELSAIVLRAERSPDADPNLIGAILPLSGRGREAGEAALHGLLLAAERAQKRGSAPRIVYRDDGSDPARAVAALDDLVTNHRVIAVVGPMSAASARAVAAEAQKSAVPLVVMVPDRTATEQSANVFRLLPSPLEEARSLAERAASEGVKRVAIMHSDTPYGLALRDAFDAELRRARITNISSVSYPPATTNLVKQAEAVAKSNADAVVFADSAGKVALLAPALSVHGVWSVPRGAKPPEGRTALFLIPSIGFDSSLAQTTRRYLQGAVFAVPFDPMRADIFRDAYKAEYQSEPNLFSASAFDAYQILRTAIAAGAVTRADLVNSLGRTRAADIAGVSDGFSSTRGPRTAVVLEALLGEEFVAAD
jgi:branched-chain amino acid transport system substrate-binding protein